MDGIRGHHNWQWIFILEGIATILVGFVAFFCVADFPEDAKWLTMEERKFVIARAQGTEGTQHITRRDILMFFQDPGNVLGSFMYLGKLIMCALI